MASASQSLSDLSSPSKFEKEIHVSTASTPDLESNESIDAIYSVSTTPEVDSEKDDSDEELSTIAWKNIEIRKNYKHDMAAHAKHIPFRNIKPLYSRAEKLHSIPTEFEIEERQWDLDLDRWRTMEEAEPKYLPTPGWAQYHPGLSFRHRAVVINWISEVSHIHKCSRETFYIAAHYFDLFMSRTENISPNMLQMIAGACLYIASKQEEYEPVRVWEDIDHPNVQDIFEVEAKVLEILQWNLLPPSAALWIHLYITNAVGAYPERYACQFPVTTDSNVRKHVFDKNLMRKIFNLVDAALHHPLYLTIPTSLMTAGIFDYLTSPTDEILRVCTGYSKEQIKTTTHFIKRLCLLIPEEDRDYPLDTDGYFYHVHIPIFGERIAGVQNENAEI